MPGVQTQSHIPQNMAQLAPEEHRWATGYYVDAVGFMYAITP